MQNAGFQFPLCWARSPYFGWRLIRSYAWSRYPTLRTPMLLDLPQTPFAGTSDSDSFRCRQAAFFVVCGFDAGSWKYGYDGWKIFFSFA